MNSTILHLPATHHMARFRSSLRASISALRRSWFPTQDELDYAYLAGAIDLYDLEDRERELIRRRSAKLRVWGL